MKPARILTVLTCLAAVCVLGAACKTDTSEPVTEVLVQVYADAVVQKAADTLTIEMFSGPTTTTTTATTITTTDELTASEPEVFDLGDTGFHWPATLALVAKPSHEDHVFELTLYLEKRGVVVARGRVRSGFVKGQTLLLQTTLSAQCLGKLDCNDDETCVVSEGRATCESAAVDAGSLPRVTDQSKTSDAGSGTQDAGAASDAGNMSAHDAGADASPADAGGGPKDAGGSGCTPQPEQCDNGIDDDCNGDVDCADRACDAVTQCVPNAKVFVIVGANDVCPAGYDAGDAVYQGLEDPGCSGCSCDPDPKICRPLAFVYPDAVGCTADQVPYSKGDMLPDAITSDCSRSIGKQYDQVSVQGAFGVRAQVVSVPDTCSAKGVPSALEPTWATAMKLCVKNLRHDGCGINAFCAPAQDKLCWAGGLTACPNPLVANTWWQSYDDKRTCQPCGCEPSGGSCGDVKVQVEDGTCGSTSAKNVLADGDKVCDSFSPDTTVRAVGAPKTGECKAVSPVDGRVMPTLPVNLCCQP